jgi:hypothetical protein
MNSFRSAILSGKGLNSGDPVVRGKQGQGADTDDLSSVQVPRSESRRHNQRDDDRHRLEEEQGSARYKGEIHAVDVINLSGGGAMIKADFRPMLWERIDLILAEGSEIECAVRWLRDDRIGLEFAHETRIDCDADARDRLLLDVIQRSFPDVQVRSESAAGVVEEKPQTDDSSRRTERRHPLIWMGSVLYNHDCERVRLRNISEHGALIESPVTYPEGAEVLLDLGDGGQHFARSAGPVATRSALPLNRRSTFPS